MGKGVKELLEEMLDGKILSWFSVWVKFFDNFFHGLFFDFVEGLLVHLLNLLHIFVWVRHNFNLTPPPHLQSHKSLNPLLPSLPPPREGFLIL
jgi:hypothetical protein